MKTKQIQTISIILFTISSLLMPFIIYLKFFNGEISDYLGGFYIVMLYLSPLGFITSICLSLILIRSNRKTEKKINKTFLMNLILVILGVLFLLFIGYWWIAVLTALGN